MKCPRVRGFTIAEVLIYSVLSLLIVSLLIGFFLANKRLGEKGDAETELFRSGLEALRQIQILTGRSNEKGIVVSPRGEMLAVRTVASSGPKGANWSDDIVFFWQDDKLGLIKGWLSSTEFGQDDFGIPALAQDDFDKALQELRKSKQFKVIGAKCSHFQVEHPKAREIKVQLELEARSHGDKIEKAQRRETLLIPGEEI
ncbi:MAG: hypothetical protein KC800_00245 [Candidatus Eremiobacteraeota bacterium]|nr:hypothetical protein [Candidatus Eremiobacteraeota bacterium]